MTASVISADCPQEIGLFRQGERASNGQFRAAQTDTAAMESIPEPRIVLSLYRGLIEARSPPPRMRDIAVAVAERNDMSLDQLRGPCRAQVCVRPRQEAMWLIYQTGRFSLPQIGRFFERDHTTVLHALRRHKERMAGEPRQ